MTASHIARLGLVKRERTPRKPQPFDRFSKAELWERLQTAERRCDRAAVKAQRIAHAAHNEAQGFTGKTRRVLLSLRDLAYKARVVALGEQS